MNFKKIINYIDKFIYLLFHALFLIIPLLVTNLNYELFEFNKMIAVYLLTILISCLWLIKMILKQKIIFRRTPFDIPILLFLLSQLTSLYFSIDPHVSLWGYYSRFHGGILSITAFIILFYAFVSNITSTQLITLTYTSIFTAGLLSIYGILEHFGYSFSCYMFTGRFNIACWVQDVQNRVFATLGQPNWLAAYLDIIIPLTLILFVANFFQSKRRIPSAIMIAAYFMLYLALLYTKSRSGFIAFAGTQLIFWPLVFLKTKQKQKIFYAFLITILSTSFITLKTGTPITKINKYIRLIIPQTQIKIQQEKPIPAGLKITESGEIRRIVWKGAIEITRSYPFFGTGPETFAFAYYKFKPKEHNLTSEWDFLYNKAHNEYLNFAATTGLFGLGTYLIFLLSVIITGLKAVKKRNLKKPQQILITGVFCAWITILITNFFGFSVVIVSVYFWLLTGYIAILSGKISKIETAATDKSWGIKQYILVILTLYISINLILYIVNIWRADFHFARADKLSSQKSDYAESYKELQKAIILRQDEPVYHNELSYTSAVLTVAAYEQKKATLAASLEEKAKAESDLAITISPSNVSFWKTRTRLFYLLSQINNDYLQSALNSIKKAKELAPTDAKITYNLGLIQMQLGKTEQALKTLEETIKLKPDYRDPHYALALYLRDKGEDKKAIEHLNYILKKINPNDEEVKSKLAEWKK